jgi:hypothetical protein
MRRFAGLLGTAAACAVLAVGCKGERTKPQPIPGNTGKANPQGSVGKPKPMMPPKPPPPPKR